MKSAQNPFNSNEIVQDKPKSNESATRPFQVYWKGNMIHISENFKKSDENGTKPPQTQWKWNQTSLKN